jgi:hypothetical protein
MKKTIIMAVCATTLLLCYCGRAQTNAAIELIEEFPVLPAIKDADPQVRSYRTFRVPIRLVVKRTPDRIGISVDMTSLETVDIKVGSKMLAAFRHRITIVAGNKRLVVAVG